ncbi:transcript variant X3 [Nothobranchius furzeri]|uniref:Transcript variant X3 n=1 Tax=Nothobranchius furzeri TaxID=105023 RepID=A0A9D2Z2K9_NOTFU|nr:transcript variant X3 [Nothobranchius furzeri]
MKKNSLEAGVAEPSPLMAVMANSTWPYPVFVPHYLLPGDPFASKLSREADILAAFYICIIGILSAIGNGYVIYVTIKRKTKLKPPELMTVNLALFDFGISVTGKPFFVASSFSHRWLFGWNGCRFYGWTGFFFGCGSLITMTVVSLDRYLKICHLQYASIIVYSYVMIICKVKSTSEEISHYDARIRNNHALEMKLTKVAMLICAGFLIAWIPYAVVSVVSAFGEPNSIPIPVSVIPTLLAKSSAMYNPIIYQLVDLRRKCSSCCLMAMKKRRNFRKTRFFAISGSFKDPAPDKEAQIEM